MKKTVAIIAGTRPECVKMAPIYFALQESKTIQPIFLSTGQHRQMLDQTLGVFGIKPEFDLNLMQPGQTLPDLTGRVIQAASAWFVEHKPAAVLVQGDTTTVLASAIALNKRKSCEIFQATGIKIPESKLIKKSDGYTKDPIKRPYVIKPLSQGSSVGVKVIFPEDIFSFGDYDFPYGDEILVEEYIKGREMQVAVLNGRAIGILEIKLLKNKRFYDYETKYTEGFSEHLLPAPVSSEIYNNMKAMAEKACIALDCVTGMIRVEMIYSSEKNALYMLEVNTHPGMTPLSICPEIATLENMSYKDLVKEILEEARFE